MCLIIAPGKDGKPAVLPEDVFDYAFGRNNDGFGAMWAKDGKVEHVKLLGLKKEEEYDYMKSIAKDNPGAVFHMRLKTHGKVIPSLCHPFRILHRNRHGKDLFFMHNGVLGAFSQNLQYGQSDTTAFKDKVLVPLLTRNPDALDDPSIMETLNKLTSGSRLLFMDGDGKVWRTSENSWNNEYGLTLSNTYMLPAKKYDPPKYTPPKANDNVIGFHAPPSKGPNTPKDFTIWRKVQSTGGGEMTMWFKRINAWLLRSEHGSMWRDRGYGVVLNIFDRVEKHKEIEVALECAGENTPPPKEVDLDDDIPEFPSTSAVPASVEERLRYARLVHNCHNGNIADRTQLMADLLGMGNKELRGFIKEDPENAETVFAELIEMVFEYNDILCKDEDKMFDYVDIIFEPDHLLELNDPENHQSCMTNITEKRKEYYAKLAARAAEIEDQSKQEKVVA